MIRVVLSGVFRAWLSALRDDRARARITARIRKLQEGDMGDWKSIDARLSELRIHVGSGYRIYFIRQGNELVILLAGGSKEIAEAGHRTGATRRRVLQEFAMSNKSKRAKPGSAKHRRVRLFAFDAAEYLHNEATIAEYLDAILEEDDPELLIKALGDVARARGMAKVAKESGLGRESLYKALAPGAKPRFETVVRVARAVGVRISAKVA